MTFIQDWREEIHHARLHKPQWWFLIRILDAFKAIATLALVSAYGYGLWYILYGVPTQYKNSDVPAVQVMSSPAEADSIPAVKAGFVTISTQQAVVHRAVDSASKVASSPGTKPRSGDGPEAIAVAKSISTSKEVMRAKKTPQAASAQEADSLQAL